MNIESAPHTKLATQQALRLRRLYLAFGSYGFTLLLTLSCWHLGFFAWPVVVAYLALMIPINLAFYIAIRSGFNLRFADPSLTFAQLLASILPVFYVMFHAGPARGAFLLLAVSAYLYGLFQFRTRQFMAMTLLALSGYAAMIALLAVYQPTQVELRVEMLMGVAFAVTLLQISILGGYIGKLRRKLNTKNSELEARNQELEVALQTIRDMAIRDELTGVFNRRHLRDVLRLESMRTDRHGGAMSLCMLDIDFFRNVNDDYGHLAGDLVLKRVAEIAQAELRQTDVLCRYGGEEFAILLPQTPLAGARITAERIRLAVERSRYYAVDTELRVTVSQGVAEYIRHEDPDRMFQRADDALYRAKESGRNRTMAAGLMVAV